MRRAAPSAVCVLAACVSAGLGLSGPAQAQEAGAADPGFGANGTSVGASDPGFGASDPTIGVNGPDFVPGELIVRFGPGAGPGERAAALGTVGATVEESLALPRLKLVELDDRPVTRSADVLGHRPGVLYAEPNYIDEFAAVPDDVYFGSQWALRNTGQGVGTPLVNGTPGADIDAVAGWDRSVGGDNVLVGIADSGVFYDHPDLGPNMYVNPGESGGARETNGLDDDGNGYVDDYRGYDFFGGDNDPAPATPPSGLDRHGTQVASVAAARGNNSIGITGVAQRASILPLRVGDKSGAPTSLQVEAFTYAGKLGADVVNLSAGGPNFSQSALDAIRAAPDTLFVFAAGNDGTDNDDPATAFFPCNLNEPNVVCVAATNQDDTLRPTSNFGSQSVDLAAPGQNILTAKIGTNPATDFLFSSGTSLASPIVAGAAAVYRSLYPQATAVETRDALLAGVDALPSLAGKVESGGRLNLDQALATAPPSPVAPPDTSIELLLKAKRKQKIKKLKVRVGCGDEACEARLGGKVSARKKRGHIILAGAGVAAAGATVTGRRKGTKRFGVRARKFSIAAGRTKTVRVRLRKNGKSVRKLRKLLKNRRYRLGSRAVLRVSATDAAGNTAVRRAGVRLKP